MALTTAATGPTTAHRLAWWGVLMGTLPLLLDSAPALPLGADAMVALTLAWIAAVAVGVAAFALRCRGRRSVLALYAGGLVALLLFTNALAADRAFAAIALMGLAVALVEGVRQNRSVPRDLRAAGIPLWRPVLSALWLWSPALVLIAIGAWLNGWVLQAGERALLGTGMVDAWCTVDGSPDAPPLPCTGLPLALPAGTFTRLPDARSVQLDVDRQLDALHEAVLTQTADAAQWATPASGEQAMQEAAQLIRQSTVPARLLTNRQREALDNDLPLRSLNDRRARLQRELSRLPEPVVVRLSPFIAIPLPQAPHAVAARRTHLRQALSDVERQISDRRRDLSARTASDHPGLGLSQQLADRLNADARVRPRIDGLPKAYSDTLLKPELPPATPALRRAVARNELLALVGALREPLIAHRTAVLLPQAALARQAGLLGTHCALLLPDAEGDHHRIVPCPPILEAEGSVGQPPAAVAAGEAASGSPTEAAPTLSLTRLPLRTSIDLSIDAWADRAEARARRAFDGAGDQAAQAERLARGGARALFAGVPTALGLKTPRCGLDPFCAVGNWAKRRAEGVYRDFRDDAERRFVRQVDRNAELRLLSAHEQLDVARQGVRDNLSAARGWAHEAVAGLFNLGDTLGTLMTIWLVMVAIKSYLYVLALEVFHETGASSVGFHDAAPIQGRIEAQDGITIPADCRIPVLSFEVGVNQRKGIVLWKPWVASVHRLLHGRWAMSRGSHTPQAQMHFPSRQGSIGAVWHLQPGESVVLHFGNLLGFTENLHIRSEISLRLSTLLFGRFVFHVAHCPAEPGLLLLSLPGNAVLPDAAVQEVPLGRIRAFDRQARFRVASQRSWRAVFKDGFNLRRVDGDPASRGLVLVGASSGDELRFQGLIRFVRTFVWPL